MTKIIKEIRSKVDDGRPVMTYLFRVKCPYCRGVSNSPITNLWDMSEIWYEVNDNRNLEPVIEKMVITDVHLSKNDSYSISGYVMRSEGIVFYVFVFTTQALE